MPLDPETFDALIDTVRRFVAERLRPLEEQVAEDDEVPDEIVREMREMGLFGLSIPEEYGGLGLTMSEEMPASPSSSAAPRPPSAPPSAPMSASAARAWSCSAREEQKTTWLPGIASGEIVTSFALTEPGAGSDSASVQTRAVARRRRLSSSTAPSASSPMPTRPRSSR